MSDLIKLISTKQEDRDKDWEIQFFHALAHGQLKVQDEDVKAGPDGWPYLFAETAEDATEPTIKILTWLAEKGVGLVLNPQKGHPDYVFSYGMVWNFCERGAFVIPTNKTMPTGDVEIKEGTQYIVGQPSDDYLPGYVRKVIRQFFNDQDVKDPKIVMLSTNGEDFDLCFSIESLGSPAKSEYMGIGEAIAWFLPNHYSIMLVSENDFKEFESL